MPGFVVTGAAMTACPHAAPGMLAPTGARVLIGGQPVALLSDIAAVAGCPFVVVAAPSPCVTLSWPSGSTRVLVQGQPVLLQDSVGLGKNVAQVPQGPAVVLLTQTRVTGA
jgi:hypothetical protein